MKNIVLREVKRIKGYPQSVIDFMSKEDSWVEIDGDGVIGENALLSYPDIIYVLSLKNASEEVLSFFKSFENDPKSDFVLKHSLFIEEVEELSDEDNEFMSHYCVFAYFYGEIDEESVNKDSFEDGNHVFIYNGLDFDKEQEAEEQAVLAINVSGYEVF